MLERDIKDRWPFQNFSLTEIRCKIQRRNVERYYSSVLYYEIHDNDADSIGGTLYKIDLDGDSVAPPTFGIELFT